MFSSNKKPNESSLAITYKNSSPHDPLEFAISHHSLFSASDAARLILNHSLESSLQPVLSKRKMNNFLYHVYQGNLVEVRAILDQCTITGLKLLLTTRGEIVNFFGRALNQTPLQMALRIGDSALIKVLEFYLKIKDENNCYFIPNGEEIIIREKKEYNEYMAKQEQKILVEGQKIVRNKYERDLYAYERVYSIFKDAKDEKDPRLDQAFNAFRKYLYEADQRDEPFNAELLCTALSDGYQCHSENLLFKSPKLRKFFNELIGAIQAIAPRVYQKAFAQECGMQGIMYGLPHSVINRETFVEFCPWDSNGTLSPIFPANRFKLKLGVNGACDLNGPRLGYFSSLSEETFRNFFLQKETIFLRGWEISAPTPRPVLLSSLSKNINKTLDNKNTNSYLSNR